MAKEHGGFLLIDTLIAGLIISSSIAATMYLFRVGFESLMRASRSNAISAKVAPAINLMKTLDLDKGGGSEDLGDGITVQWNSALALQTHRTTSGEGGVIVPTPSWVYLYNVRFTILSKDLSRDYEAKMLRYKYVESSGG